MPPDIEQPEQEEPSFSKKDFLFRFIQKYKRELGIACCIFLLLFLGTIILFFAQKEAVEPVAPLPLVYEETLASNIQELAIRTDALLMRALIELKASPDSIEVFALPTQGHEDFKARFLGFYVPVSPEEFAQHLTKLLQSHLPEVSLVVSGPRQFSLLIKGIRTHELFLEIPKKQIAEEAKIPLDIAAKDRIAIVIDDLGEDTQLARKFAESKLPITFAIWPLASHRDATRKIAKQNKLDIIVHLPMEPRSYPQANPGPGALFLKMNAQKIQSIVKKNLDLIPDAVGVNNHMGSRFTEDQAAMYTVLKILADRGLFFLDSRTTGKSKAAYAARESSTPFYGRDVFLDNQLAIPYILGQLKTAEKVARRRGTAIAIGHPHEETLQAIQTWAANLPEDIVIVPLSSLPFQNH